MILNALNGSTPQDPVLVLGQIAWFSQFKDEHPTFGAEDLARWFRGAPMHSAESLLAEGVTAGIFVQGLNESYQWANTLVRDGCAALYLREQFGSLSRKTTAEMVRRLHEAGSVAILALAFDSAMLQRTIDDLLAAPQLLGDILDQLLTGQMLMRLAQSSTTVDIVANNIFNAGETLVRESSQDPYKSLTALSKAIARLRCLSNLLTTYLTGPLNLGGARGPIATGAEAIGNENNKTFFEEMVQRSADRDTAREMAARLWRPEGLRTLMDELGSDGTGLTMERVAELLSVFLAGHEEPFLFETVRQLTDGDFLDRYGRKERFAQIACRAILKRMFSLTTSIDRTTVIALCRASVRQIDSGHCLVAGELARWASCGIHRDVGLYDVDWTGYRISTDLRSTEGLLLSKRGAYAVPKRPFPPDTVLNILGTTFWNSSPLKGILTLPAKADLEHARIEIDAIELIRDNLPQGYVYDARQVPQGVQLATWDGVNFAYIDARNFNRAVDKVVWRPKMCLSQAADVIPV